MVFQDLTTELEEAQCILNTMSPQRKNWEQKRSEMCSRVDSAPGHAMLCAAGVCYLARSSPEQHDNLLNNWLGYCSGGIPLGSFNTEQHKLQPTQVKILDHALDS